MAAIVAGPSRPVFTLGVLPRTQRLVADSRRLVRRAEIACARARTMGDRFGRLAARDTDQRLRNPAIAGAHRIGWLPGEYMFGVLPDDARHWADVYNELLDTVVHLTSACQPVRRLHLVPSEIHLRHRLAYWRKRSAEIEQATQPRLPSESGSRSSGQPTAA